ncbi:hypothetical protein [Streptomyces luteireticuli]|uniref:hypothetical protein n=1 Tax=Streptomyces luteireticuli TaxID=173858 RepID=UPI0035589E6A
MTIRRTLGQGPSSTSYPALPASRDAAATAAERAAANPETIPSTAAAERAPGRRSLGKGPATAREI